MSTINIEGNELIFFTKKEIAKADLGEDKFFYMRTFKYAEVMSKNLRVKCPDIAFVSLIRAFDDLGGITARGATLYTPKDVPELKNNLISMSLENYDNLSFIGTLAHEMRHIWQDTYYPNMNKIHAISFEDSLEHPAEIDADGYAIWFLTLAPDMYIEKAASIMCPKEKKYYPKAYMHRIEKAEEIKAFFDEKMTANSASYKKPKIASFLNISKKFKKKED